MAINVNKVYRVVLSILNKEQRGYLTPDQFNRIARQSQLDIYEKTFYDYNRAMRKQIVGDFREYSDIASNIKEKIDIFSKEATVSCSAGVGSEPSDLYRLIAVSSTNRQIEFEEVRKEEIPYLKSSKLNQPTSTFPIYYSEGSSIKILPADTTSILVDYLTLPSDPQWAFTGGGSNAYTYDSVNSVDFQIHQSDETDLVTKILAYSGVIIKDPTVIQIAAQKEVNDFNQDNV